MPTLSRTASVRTGTYLDGNLWSKEGIITEGGSETMTRIHVNHFTSFVVFASEHPSVASIELYLSILNVVICLVSCACIITGVTIYAYYSNKEEFKKENKRRIDIFFSNLSAAFLLVNIVTSLYGLTSELVGTVLCNIIAAFIHYAWLTVYSWCLFLTVFLVFKLFARKLNE